MKISLNNKTLDELDMSDSDPTLTFSWKSGEDHYRLLRYLASLFNNTILIDIGTRNGASAIAMAKNTSNMVHSFDIKACPGTPYKNVDYHVCDLKAERGFWPMIFSSPLISLDTEHDGIFEREFLAILREHSFKGLLYMDDINTDKFPEVRKVWDEIPEIKIDVTKYGHFSGSGVVLFDPTVEFVLE